MPINRNPHREGFEMRKYDLFIGIDVGTETGYAEWSATEQRLLTVESMKIHEVMDRVKEQHKIYGSGLFVRFEDARKRNWFGDAGREKLQGAGSIKRDSAIWEDFLTSEGISFEAVAPKRNRTKTAAEYFKRVTGWQKRTNEHSRDAAMLVVGLQ